MRRVAELAVAVAVVTTSAACSTSSTAPGLPQLLIYIDTDAIVPSSAAAPMTALDAPPLFDSIRIEGIHDGQVCGSCKRDFGVVQQTFQADRVSLGVVAPLTPGDSLRVRLYPSAYVSGNDPIPAATIDVTVDLPPLPEEGTSERTLFLPTESVGTPTHTTLMPGRPSPSKVGTWAPARRVDCPAPAPDGEVCVPGGAFWMGNPLVAHVGVRDGDLLRLVALSPFYVDSKEVTAGEYRPFISKLGVAAYGTGEVACDFYDYCSLLMTSGPDDAYPMNCVDPAKAAGYCQAQGKELLTEAQFEYVASGLGEGYSFVWGDDTPQCGDAVLARGGIGAFFGYPDDCLTVSPKGTACDGRIAGGISVGGPALGGSGALDELTITLPSGSGSIYDLIGNVGEIARDDWNTLTDPCWAKPGVYMDPLCQADSGASAVRGGDWTVEPIAARAAARDILVTGTNSPQIGFRCARAAK
jgi:formylglycine-generating enzyme